MIMAVYLCINYRVEIVIAFSLITSSGNMLCLIFLYHCKACQMQETIKQKALQLEPVLGNYKACKVSHIFPVEVLFNYNPLNLPS